MDQQPAFHIQCQYLKDCSFENNHLLEWVGQKAPEIDVKVDSLIEPAAEDQFHVALQVKITANVEQKTVMVFDVTYECLVFLSKEIGENDKRALLCVHTPNLLFPYVRQIVSSITGNAGIPPILLAPVDFATAFMEEIQKEKQKAGENIH